MSTLQSWWRPQPHAARRSVDLVRVVVAVVVAVHPLYTIAHPPALQALAAALQACGLPAATALAWMATGALLVAAPALLLRRFAAPAALAIIAILAAGAALLYAPRWYVAGGASQPGHPGVEFNVLVMTCAAAIAWTYWPRRAPTASGEARAAAVGLDIIRLGGALLILPHPLHAFVRWDVDGMRGFARFMSDSGFPCALPLVWGMLVWQIVCSTLIATRRFVVPACLGHLAVLGTGIVIVHYPDWFIVGPGENGMEFPIVYIACYASCILAYWPRSDARETSASTAACIRAAPPHLRSRGAR